VDKLKTLGKSEASHATLTLRYALKMLARHRRGAPKRRHSIGSTLDGVNVMLKATGSCVPDHSERVVGDGEDECGIRASEATTISKHQDSMPRASEVYTDGNDEGQLEISIMGVRAKF
jgi:hypothetical protein